jgi:hypothetical protein
MERDWEEKRIAELFHEMKQEDAALAPPFSTGGRAATRFPTSAALAVAVVAALVVVAFFSVIFLRAASLRDVSGPSISEETAGASITPRPSAPIPSSPAVTQIAKASKFDRRRKRPARQSIILISQWQSPTDFLLRTPGEQLLKSVPRLGGSLAEIKAIMPGERN